jgi:hypothetical protein
MSGGDWIERFADRLDNISPDFLTLYTKQKVHHGKVEQRLKTANGYAAGFGPQMQIR